MDLLLQSLFQLVGMSTVQLGKVQLALAVLQALALLELVPCHLTEASIPLHHALQQAGVLPLRLLIDAAGAVDFVQEGGVLHLQHGYWISCAVAIWVMKSCE